MQKILKQIRKADQDFSLINEHDIIVVGVSGGKDSMLLLKALHQYSLFKEKSFQVIGVNLVMGFSGMDMSSVVEYCKDEGIPFVSEETSIYEILKHYPKKDGSVDCSRCSKLKRGAIINAATRLHATKVAFAHHADDAIETLFLNSVYGAKLQTFQPKIILEDKQLEFIRPFVYTFEDDIIKTMKQEGIPIVVSTCPNDGHTKRQDVKELLQDIYKNFKGSKQNLLSLLTNQDIRLWKKEE